MRLKIALFRSCLMQWQDIAASHPPYSVLIEALETIEVDELSFVRLSHEFT